MQRVFCFVLFLGGVKGRYRVLGQSQKKREHIFFFFFWFRHLLTQLLGYSCSVLILSDDVKIFYPSSCCYYSGKEGQPKRKRKV